MVVRAGDVADVEAGELGVPEHLEEGGVARPHVQALEGFPGLSSGGLIVLGPNSIDKTSLPLIRIWVTPLPPSVC